ncbi:MAG: hypothetical protein ACLRM8_04880 [Alistipes sp.]
MIAETLEEADAALKDMLLDDKFGEGKVVVEDFLTGPEFSFMCFVSGRKVWPMALAQDHKRAFDATRAQHGRYGAYSPLPFVTAEDERYALERSCSRRPTRWSPKGVRSRGAVRRSDEDSAGDQGDRVQRPFRRSRPRSCCRA